MIIGDQKRPRCCWRDRLHFPSVYSTGFCIWWELPRWKWSQLWRVSNPLLGSLYVSQITCLGRYIWQAKWYASGTPANNPNSDWSASTCLYFSRVKDSMTILKQSAHVLGVPHQARQVSAALIPLLRLLVPHRLLPIPLPRARLLRQPRHPLGVAQALRRGAALLRTLAVNK